MIIGVTGDRNYTDEEKVDEVLKGCLTEFGKIVIIHGDARGLDNLAKKWAIENNVKEVGYRVDWKDFSPPFKIVRSPYGYEYNVLAGFKRNQKMIDEAGIELLLVFPGGKGTKDMTKRAKKADIPIRFV